jgi:hypothetical protein
MLLVASFLLSGCAVLTSEHLKPQPKGAAADWRFRSRAANLGLRVCAKD